MGKGNNFSLFGSLQKGGGVSQSQVLSMVSTPRSFLGGTPVPARGCPRTGVPPSWDRTGVPPARTGVPSPQLGLEYPPAMAGVPPPPPSRDGIPPRQNSRASTCHAAGGMPLAVTQEDFLVCKNFRTSGSNPKFRDN